MAEFLISVWHDFDEPMPEPEDMQQAFAQVDAFNSALQAADALVFAGGLQPPAEAVVVHSDAEGDSHHDGPMLDTKVQLGGFWVIDVADHATAKDWAAKAAAACMSEVELRPFQTED